MANIAPPIWLATACAVAGCSAQPVEKSDVYQPVACSLEGAEQSGAAADDVCAMFRDALVRSKRHDVVSITLTAQNPRQAGVRAISTDGKTVVELGFRVMDSTLTLAAWQDFARNFERELSVNSGQ